MTRTSRSAFPRAIIKDRSESKSGLDKSIKKNGAGPHSWGSYADERELEDAAYDDENLEAEAEGVSVTSESSASDAQKPAMERSTSSVSAEDVQTAKDFRKNVLKSDSVDLAAIARTSAAVSSSPP